MRAGPARWITRDKQWVSGIMSEKIIADNSGHTESYVGAAYGLICAEQHEIFAPAARRSSKSGAVIREIGVHDPDRQ